MTTAVAPSTSLRIGLVVPPENPTAEPELHELLRGRADVFTTRFPTTPGLELRAMLESYNDVLPTVLTHFGRLRLDATVVACSASHYLLGPDGDRRFCDELSRAFGYPVVSSTLAILAACRAAGVTRLTLVSPYQPWLTDTSRRYWEAAGLVVDDVVEVPHRAEPVPDDAYDPYVVTTEQIVDGVTRHGTRRDLPADAALLFTGTGMGTLAAMDELSRRDPGRWLLSSNLAAARWAEQLAQLDSRVGTRPI